MTTDPLTTVTEALFDALADAMDTLFPAHEGDHATLIDDMLDGEVIDHDQFNAGRTHADNLAAMGTKPSLEHAPLVGMLAISGMSHTLGFIVQTQSHYV